MPVVVTESDETSRPVDHATCRSSTGRQCRHLGPVKSTRTATGLPDLVVSRCNAQAVGCVPLAGDLVRVAGTSTVTCEGCALYVEGGKRLTLLQQAGSLSGTMARTAVRKVLTGEALASLEVIQSRTAICEACSHNQSGICDLCDCSLDGGRVLSNKLAHASVACPDGRWSAVK